MIEVNDRISLAGALDAEDLVRARSSGVALVIDLREDAEPVPRGLAPRDEEIVAAALGLAHRSVPIGPGRPVRRALAEVDRLVRSSAGRVLLHCASGRRAAAAAVAVLGRPERWSAATCAGALRALGFEVQAMPALGRAVADFVGRDPAEERVEPGSGI